MGLLRVVIAGVLGLCVGSFLNVVIARVPLERSIVRPGSMCLGCETELRRRDLIPVVSWIVLRARCRTCSTAISPRYPIVEVLTAALFAGLAWRFADLWTLAAFLVFGAGCVALSAIDLDTHTLPRRVIHVVAGVGGALLALGGLVGHDAARLGGSVVAAAAVGAALCVIWLIAPQGFGFGDVRFGAMLAMFLGWLGAAHVFVGLALSFVIGAIVGIGLMVAGSAGRRTAVPFGPFLSAGAIVAVLAGGPIIHWWLPSI